MVLPNKAVLERIPPNNLSTEQEARYPHSMTEASIMRTFNPTYASYSGDGTGRDSYIILNNGGLTSQCKKNMMWSTKIKNPCDYRPTATKPAPTFKYPSDGSGRDSYVI